MNGRLTSPKTENTASLIRDVKEPRRLLCFAASYLKNISFVFLVANFKSCVNYLYLPPWQYFPYKIFPIVFE
jgi:hypothetical protein